LLQGYDLPLTANINSIGVTVSIAGGAHADTTGKLEYRKTGDPAFVEGHFMPRVEGNLLAGRVWFLLANTAYDVKVTKIEPGQADSVILNSAITTRRDNWTVKTGTQCHVDGAVGSSGNGLSRATAKKTVQEGVDQLATLPVGSWLTVWTGTYPEEVNVVDIDGNSSNYYLIEADTTEGVVRMEGSDRGILNKTVTWRQEPSIAADVFSTPLSTLQPDQSTNMVRVDGVRIYGYSEDEESDAQTAQHFRAREPHGDVEVTDPAVIPKSAFFSDDGNGMGLDQPRLYVYLEAGDSPQNHTVHAAEKNYGFNVSGSSFLVIRGFTIRFYGGKKTKGFTTAGIRVNNSPNVVIRDCQFLDTAKRTGAHFLGSSTDGLVQDCTCQNESVWEFGNLLIKSTLIEGASFQFSSARCVMRRVTFENDFRFCKLGDSDDCEVYDCTIKKTSGSSFEVEGTGMNISVHHCRLENYFHAFSTAPVEIGPIWFFYNTCFEQLLNTTFKVGSLSGVIADGLVFWYHITVFRSGVMPVYWALVSRPITSPLNQGWKNNRFRNNCWQNFVANKILNFAITMASPQGEQGVNNTFDYNLYSVASGPIVKWNDIDYTTIAAFNAATGEEAHGIKANPQFVDPANGDLTLLPTSPCINAGLRIKGINDMFAGSAPDIGSFEFSSGVPVIPPPDPPPANVPNDLLRSYVGRKRRVVAMRADMNISRTDRAHLAGLPRSLLFLPVPIPPPDPMPEPEVPDIRSTRFPLRSVLAFSFDMELEILRIDHLGPADSSTGTAHRDVNTIWDHVFNSERHTIRTVS
jgi:hypothetical protein